MQGRIACCNVLSDVYAMGIARVDHMLMILAVSLEMAESEREITTREMIKGFNDCCLEARTLVTGGQTILNPWPIIGGVANTMCDEGEYIKPNFAKSGDVLILTKPLGTQVAVNLHQWLIEKNEKWTKSQQYISFEEAKSAYYLTCESMCRLNKDSAKLMKKYQSHGATDITGFGLVGHAQNLVAVQQEPVDFEIHSLPLIHHMGLINEHIFNFRLTLGYSAETSGGLLVILDPSQVQGFIKEHREVYGQDVWVVGDVIPRAEGSEPKASIKADFKIIEVSEFLHD